MSSTPRNARSISSRAEKGSASRYPERVGNGSDGTRTTRASAEEPGNHGTMRSTQCPRVLRASASVCTETTMPFTIGAAHSVKNPRRMRISSVVWFDAPEAPMLW